MSSAGRESPSFSRGRPQKPCAPCGSRMLPEKAAPSEGASEWFQHMLCSEPGTAERRKSAAEVGGVQASLCLRRGVVGMGRAGQHERSGRSGADGLGLGSGGNARRQNARHGAERKRCPARVMWAQGKKSRVAERGRSVRRGDAAGKISRSAGEAACFLTEGARFVIGPGWNTRSCRGVRNVRAGDRIPRRKRVRAIRWKRCRRALPRPGGQTSCPLPRRASA